MIRRIRQIWDREMIRPLVYKVFTRGILALAAAQLAHVLLPETWPLRLFSSLSLLLGTLFLVFAFLAWLRLDGARIPQMKLPRFRRKDPAFLSGDLADHIQDEIRGFDDLDPEEQDVCVLLADLILAAACLVLAIIL